MLTLENLERLAYNDPSWFAYLASNGVIQRFDHIRLISEKLRAVERGDIKRLAISCPPQHGKSEIVSRTFPSWHLGRRPDRKLICASYGMDLSETAGRANREKLEEFGESLFGVEVDPADRSVFSWSLKGQRGSLTCVGVGSGTTGKPADGIVIDDPVKDYLEATSATRRQQIWDWFLSVAQTRLSRDGWVVVIQTRWHPDDLVGRLLDLEPHKWETINLPAIDGDGLALCEPLHPLEQLQERRQLMSDFMWSALYQGEPKPPEGTVWDPELFQGVFWPTDFEVEDDQRTEAGWPVGECRFFVVCVDTSYGNPTSDYQAVCIMGFTGRGHIYVEFGLGREGLTSFARKIASMATRIPGVPTVYIEEFKFTDGRATVKDALTEELRRRGLGLPIQTINPSERDMEDAPKSQIKDARIMTLDRAINQRQFRFIDTPETRQGVDQLAEFRLAPRPRAHRVDAPDAMARTFARVRKRALALRKARRAHS